MSRIDIMKVTVNIQEDGDLIEQELYFMGAMMDAPKNIKISVLENAMSQLQKLLEQVKNSDSGDVMTIPDHNEIPIVFH